MVAKPNVKKWIDYALWPIIVGLSVAIIIIFLAPLLQNASQNVQQSQIPTPANNPTISSVAWSGPVSYADAVKRAAPSVVNISSYRLEATRVHPFLRDPVFRQFFNSAPPQYQQRLQSTLGSGVIISDEGFLLTNKHVIRNAAEISVQLTDGRIARAETVGTDDDSDLAVLKIDLDNLIPITIGMPDEAEVGDVVLAIGNPFGIGQSVSQGIISAKNRIDLDNRGIQNYMQTDAAINPGNSGGALVDAYGNLLGINTLVVNDNSSNSGVGFAIPANVALAVMEDIIDFGRVVKGWLGLGATPLTLREAKALNLSFTDGWLIRDVDRTGPAFKAGLQPGDVMTQINGQALLDPDQIGQQISQTRPGDELTIEVWRNGKPYNIVATVEEKPPTS